MDDTLLFAIAYFHGRAHGNDEPMKQEIEARFGEGFYATKALELPSGERLSLKNAYEMGVSDYCAFDEDADMAQG